MLGRDWERGSWGCELSDHYWRWGRGGTLFGGRGGGLLAGLLHYPIITV